VTERTLDLSIIVVNWNTRELLAQALESVYATVGDIACQVLVVNNGSTDGSAEMVETSFPQAQVLPNAEKVGQHRGCAQLTGTPPKVAPGSVTSIRTA